MICADTRQLPDGTRRRRYKCLCGERLSTLELPYDQAKIAKNLYEILCDIKIKDVLANNVRSKPD